MLFNMSEDEWKSVISVHLDGHFNLVHHLGKHWRQRHKAGELDGQRSFVSVSSGSARGSVGQINYSAAKAGILGLTRTAARELERYNVRVNAMVPAALTPMMEDNVPDEVLADLPTDDLNPERVAPLPVALISERAKDITGWTFAIAGNSVFTISDPEFGRELTMEGGWKPPELADSLDDLLEGEPRSKTNPGGLIGKLSED
jgi:NAD(P)-dependent dehydrogenase (short-subunit alcohol dehydrogenase family)